MSLEPEIPGTRIALEISSSSRIRALVSLKSDVHRSACSVSQTLRRGSLHSCRNSTRASTIPVSPARTADDYCKERWHDEPKIAAISLFCELTNVSIKVV